MNVGVGNEWGVGWGHVVGGIVEMGREALECILGPGLTATA